MEPVRWGVLGVSAHFRLRVFVPTRDSELVRIHGIASRSKEKAETAAREFGIPNAYGSYDALLKDEDIEAVFIPLPNHMHVEWVKKAADRGKHILCEKPFGMNAQEVKEAVEHAEKKKVMLMEAFMYKLHPQWRRVRDIVSTGEIGRILSVNTIFAYDLTDPGNIRNVLAMGGGALRDIGCYAINCARFVLGKEPARAFGLFNRDPGFGTDILGSCILDFGDAHSEFTIGMQNHPFQRVDIYGTGGRIVVRNPFNIFPDVATRVSVITYVGKRDLFFGPADQYRIEFDSFSRALREGKPVPTPPEDALNNQKVIDALFRCEKSGKWETV
ncbi:MAG: Gfo/Idh/MocA family oxidoreductase [Spirochaetes bacterium]|nr:Gfo/Idh/MocA family oxidoreductase [Spirochaetota bacterium]